MIRRLYIHNFRCLENFELPISGQSSVLLIGKNGSGKTTVGLALEILQKVGRGTNRVKDLVKPMDLTRGRRDVPMRFEIEVELDAKVFEYTIAFELPEDFKELRVLEEKLAVDGKSVFRREIAQVHLSKTGHGKAASNSRSGKSQLLLTALAYSTESAVSVEAAAKGLVTLAKSLSQNISLDQAQSLIAEIRGIQNPEKALVSLANSLGQDISLDHAQSLIAESFQRVEAEFRIDWHLVALPIVQERSTKDPLFIFKQWLARMVILRPIPSLITGDSEQETLQPKPDVTDFGAWFSGLLAQTPAAYTEIDAYLKLVMPDLKDIKNPVVGTDSRSLVVQFSNDQGSLPLPFEYLSDGEKCFMISALVLAANKAYDKVLCYWDEPDNYLALDEVGHFVLALRQAFQSGGQFIATSHNPEAIRRFSEENTLLLHRRNHLEPTIVRPLNQLQISGDLVSALIRGDVEA